MMVKRITILIVAASLAFLCGQSLAANAVSVSRIDGYDSTNGGLMANTPVRFYLNYEVGAFNVTMITNAYHLYSTDGAVWEPISEQFTVMFMSYFDLYAFFQHGVTGSGADTLDLYADINLPHIQGLPAGFDSNLFFIETKFSEDQIGRTVCFDTTSKQGFGPFSWAVNNDLVIPVWDGLQCFEIVDCCAGNRGDVNGDGVGPNILDLTRLVDFIFRGALAPDCQLESDVNGDGIPYHIIDLTFVVDFVFRGGPPAPACPN